MSIGCNQSEKRRFRLYFIAHFGVGEGQDVSQETWQVRLWQPSRLLAAMILCGDCQFRNGICIAIGVSESIPYRDCIVNRNSISDFRPGISAAKPLCKNSVSDFGVPYGTARAIRNSVSDRFGNRDFWKRRRARPCARCRCLKLCGLLKGKASPHSERPRS